MGGVALKDLSKRFVCLFLAGWIVLLSLCIALTLATAKREEHPYYAQMQAATDLAARAMEKVKTYKEENGIPLSADDRLKTGMLGGGDWTPITTTDGELAAKRTSCNPDWAAVFVSYFYRAGVQKGDSVGMVFSGSFPALNVCALAAAQVCGLQTCVMASAGASYYGANDPDFTFFDMAQVLFSSGVLAGKIDYFSFGGGNDTGRDFKDEDYMDFDGTASTRTAEEIRAAIRSRAETSDTVFLLEEDFEKNIENRIALFAEKSPDMKLFISVGGSLVALGTGTDVFLDTGYLSPSRFGFGRTDALGVRAKGSGLLDYFRRRGVPVVSMLNIRSQAREHSLPVDPDEPFVTGQGEIYFSKAYSPVFPLLALVASAAAIVVFFILRRRKKNRSL